MKISILLLLTLFISSGLLADQDSDENRLVKSWGFQFNAQGRLVFNAAFQQDLQYQPWKPEMSKPRVSEEEIAPAKILAPLIISAKNKTEQLLH